jgi:hypothetical protein
LSALEDQPRTVRRGTVIVEEGERSSELFIVRRAGCRAACARAMAGGRSCASICPGDVLGLPALAFDEAPETITALSDAIVCPFGRERLAGPVRRAPAAGGPALRPHGGGADGAGGPAGFGRAAPRRGRAWRPCCATSSRASAWWNHPAAMPSRAADQEEIGDATGLTAVHVNRMIRGLVEDGIIERNGNSIRLLDRARLAEEGNFTDRLEISTAWLPAAR